MLLLLLLSMFVHTHFFVALLPPLPRLSLLEKQSSHPIYAGGRRKCIVRAHREKENSERRIYESRLFFCVKAIKIAARTYFSR
jgi:hypothetical protein